MIVQGLGFEFFNQEVKNEGGSLIPGNAQAAIGFLGESFLRSAKKIAKGDFRQVLGLTLSLLVFAECIGAVSSVTLGRPTDFSLDTQGPYNKNEFKENDWNTSMPSSQSANFFITQNPLDPSKNVFTATCQGGEVGGNSCMSFVAPFNVNEKCLALTYNMTLPKEAGKGFKIPGLTSADSPTGCIDNQSFKGFSARGMGRGDKAPEGMALLEGYIYNPEKVEDCGDYYPTNPPFYFQMGQTYTMKQQVCIGTAGQRDGNIVFWVNGLQVLNISDIMLTVSDDLFVSHLQASWFYGGSTTDWAPTTNQNVSFSYFAIEEVEDAQKKYSDTKHLRGSSILV